MESRHWVDVAAFLTARERVGLSCASTDVLSVLRPTLTQQFDLELQYQRWRKAQLRSGRQVISEDKSWFPQLVFSLECEQVECSEPGKALFRNKSGDVLTIPTAVVGDAEEDSQESDFAHLADGSLSMDQIDFRSQSDLLRRQKALLERVKERKAAEELRRKQKLLSSYKGTCLWGVILCHGGFFAAGVYERSGRCIFHQSDHRYVSRKKQGGRQVSKDKHAGTNIHSAGSSVRREMEKKHQEAIEGIITAHKRELAQCDIIFLHAPGINRSFFVTDGAPLKDLEHKVRSVGMTAGKANFTEIQRVIQELSTVELRLN